MTICVAYKDLDGHVWAGTDLCVTYNNHTRKLIGPKWIEIPGHGLLMWSGRLQNTQVLNLLTYKPDIMSAIDLTSLPGAVVFSEIMRNEFIEADVGDADGEATINGSFLLATPKNIYLIDSDLSVAEIADFYAIGTGTMAAGGAFHAMIQSRGPINAEEIVTTVLDAACEWADGCKWPAEAVKVSDYIKQKEGILQDDYRNKRKSRKR